MKRTLFIILSVVAVVLIVGLSLARLTGPRIGNTFSTISASLPGDEFGYGGGAPDGPALKELAPAQAPVPARQPSSASDVYNAAQPAQERLVIENADLAIVVKDPKTSMAAISTLAKELGGFVVSSNLYQAYGQAGKEVPEASIVIRVPAEKLDEALDRIKKDAVDVPTENRSGQDVTNQYVDLQAQLKAKQAAEEKLLEIMDQATRAQDVLAIYLEVQKVQTEIEQLKGQIKYLQESAALSAISVRLIAEAGTQPIEVGPWSLGGTAKEAIQDLIVFFQGFIKFLIYFVLNTIPKLILIAIPLLLIYLAGRALYRRFRKAKPAPEEIKG
jgi:hypothetical protein